MSKALIHINQLNIKHNNKCSEEERKPVITTKVMKGSTSTVVDENVYCNQLFIKDKDGNSIAKVVYSPDKPLSCGARVWIESNSDNIEFCLES